MPQTVRIDPGGAAPASGAAPGQAGADLDEQRTVRIETSGIRTQTVALVAAALRPGLFSEVVVRKGMRSFSHLLETPVEYHAAPDLFCLDLYKEYDLSALAKLAAPTSVHQP